MNIAEQYFVSYDPKLLQIDHIHSFLSKEAYWCLGIPRSILESAIQNSLNFGVYEKKSNLQVGFARIVTDKATFAWLCDVYIEAAYRGQGLSKILMETIMQHPDLQNLRRFCLATKGSHFLYEKFGFELTKTPSYWMEIKDNDIYQRMQKTI